MGTILQCRAPKSRRTVEVMLAKVAAASIWIDRPLEQTTVRLTAERHPKISEVIRSQSARRGVVL